MRSLLSLLLAVVLVAGAAIEGCGTGATSIAVQGARLSPISVVDLEGMSGRAVFANVMIDRTTVIATYQFAPSATAFSPKGLHWREYDRELAPTSPSRTAITPGVGLTLSGVTFWATDVADHKLVFRPGSGQIFMLGSLPADSGPYRGQNALVRFDRNFDPIGVTFFGIAEGAPPHCEAHVDMGFAADPNSPTLYAQFFYQGKSGDPDNWGASLYKIDVSGGIMSVAGHAVVDPDPGAGEASFSTGNGLVARSDGLASWVQGFSQTYDILHAGPIPIQTFQVSTSSIRHSDPSGPSATACPMVVTETAEPGSRRDIVVHSGLDAYFPVGAAWNDIWRVWVVGYTVETGPGRRSTYELGTCYVALFDENFVLLDTKSLNGGAPAFRVMVATEGDDVYVAYDEMEKDTKTTTSRARLEHLQIVR